VNPIAGASAGAPRQPDTPAKIHDAAQQFESLLLAQILRSARQGGGWLGSGDASSDCAMEYAEEQFAAVMARQGGIGLAALVAQGLDAPKR
jgi:Rod binding domain-containing protein